jgi:predicted nucleotidyltransferase
MKTRAAVFAYLHGSALKIEIFRDVDVAVYSAAGVPPFALSADLKLAFFRRTGLAPDLFDVRMLNDLPEKGDLFALVFLRNLFSNHELLIDRDPLLRADFIERYGMKYRECEGLIAEVLSCGSEGAFQTDLRELSRARGDARVYAGGIPGDGQPGKRIHHEGDRGGFSVTHGTDGIMRLSRRIT